MRKQLLSLVLGVIFISSKKQTETPPPPPPAEVSLKIWWLMACLRRFTTRFGY